jgi:hypothetical protein
MLARSSFYNAKAYRNNFFPTASKLLEPKVEQEINQKLVKNQEKQKAYYDQGTKSLHPLNKGDKVRVKLNKTWTNAVVVE